MHTTSRVVHYYSFSHCNCCWLAFVTLGSDLPPANLHLLYTSFPPSFAESNWTLSIYLGSLALVKIEIVTNENRDRKTES